MVPLFLNQIDDGRFHVVVCRVRLKIGCRRFSLGDVSLLMRYLGGNYTGAHRDVHTTAKV